MSGAQSSSSDTYIAVSGAGEEAYIDGHPVSVDDALHMLSLTIA
jgi:hypothetical protein